MIDAQLEMTDKIGYLLLKKGIIDLTILEQALKIKDNDQTKLKRNLAQILVDEFNFDHDIIFREVAILYAFKELNIHPEDLPDERIAEMKNLMNRQGPDIKKMLLEHRVIPFKYDEKAKDKLVLAAVDPTDRNIAKVAYTLNVKKYEINYLRKKDYEKIIQLLAPTENEFLKLIQEADEEITVTQEDASINEEELDAEINKSALVNLVEAALVEGTRKGVSDIHILPKSGNKPKYIFVSTVNLRSGIHRKIHCLKHLWLWLKIDPKVLTVSKEKKHRMDLYKEK